MNNLLSERDTKAVFDILVEQLGVQEAQLTPDARLQADLGADSLSLMEITMALEERFGFSILDEEWEKVSTVADVFETLAELLPLHREPKLTRKSVCAGHGPAVG
jgi:acyl carrier protein